MKLNSYGFIGFSFENIINVSSTKPKNASCETSYLRTIIVHGLLGNFGKNMVYE